MLTRHPIVEARPLDVRDIVGGGGGEDHKSAPLHSTSIMERVDHALCNIFKRMHLQGGTVAAMVAVAAFAIQMVI